MRSNHRMKHAAVVAATTVAAALSAAPPAIAADSAPKSPTAALAVPHCDSAGYTASGDPRQRCTSLDNGKLFHSKQGGSTTTPIFTQYYKTGGSRITAKLGYSMSGSTHWGASVSISSGGSSKKTWNPAGDRECLNSVGLLSYAGGSFQTPATHC
ncbi:hypothetical protein [Streptomyces europaeiscabiei]|uniref:hypothetical protein n=1 Tax=Streptomyces europaeiscabiei TaxID=146819 RepID=UPI002E298370|nr:hypothetical protein [Streptomyces europaeiscabiei]